MTHLLLSPHSDDIALSLGGTLLQGQIPDATLTTVFERSSYLPYPPKQHLSLDEATDIRRAEDRAYAEHMGLQFVGLGLVDAIERDYEVEDLLTVWDYKQDANATQIISAIHEFLDRQTDCTCIWVPLAIGNHIDHVLVHQAAVQWWQASPQRCSQVEIMFYEDIPYAGALELAEVDKLINAQLGSAISQIVDISNTCEKKLSNLKFYASQMGAEDLDLVCKHAGRIIPGKFVERVWRKEKPEDVKI